MWLASHRLFSCSRARWGVVASVDCRRHSDSPHREGRLKSAPDRGQASRPVETSQQTQTSSERAAAKVLRSSSLSPRTLLRSLIFLLRVRLLCLN